MKRFLAAAGTALALTVAGPALAQDTGRALVWDMVPAGGGAYKSGKIWDPGADKTYRSKMQLEGNMLKVSGCIGPICKSQSWKKVN